MRRRLLLLPLVAIAACSEPPPPPAQVASAEAVVEEVKETERARPPHLARIANVPPSSFPHEPHADFQCSRCHETVRGHEAHANVPCRECHDAPAPSASPNRDCNSCHHASTTTYGCVHCHDRGGAPAAVKQVSVRAGAGDRLRTLPFAHTRHAQLQCTRCHARSGNAGAAVCASCHDRHHRADADCRGCHADVPRTAHPAARVHQGCAGTGCHTDAAVTALPFSRALCLVCHGAQAAHEPEGECTGCHQLKGELP